MIANKIRLKNLLFEAAMAVDKNQEGRLLQCLGEVRLALTQPVVPRPAPEDDPDRPAADREAWRAAR